MSEAIQTNSMSHKRNLSRVQRDEEELRELLKQAGVTQDETEEEEAVEAEPDSSEPSDPPVQAESVTKQEEEPKAEAQEEDLSTEEKNFKKRYGDLRRHMQEKEKETALKLEKLQSQLESATKNELILPKSDEEIEAWAKTYPDVAGIVEAIADKKAMERSDDLDKRLKEIEKLRSQARKEKSEAELYNLHPDFATIRGDDAFHEWAKDQPKIVQDALYDNVEDVKSVARVLDLYKADKGIKTTKRASSEDKSAASSVKARKAAPIDPNDSSSYLRESQVAKMSIKEYEVRAEEIMDAQRSGKFIYDVSKK